MKQYKCNLICILLIYSLDSFGIALAYPIFTPLLLETSSLFFSASTSLAYRTLFLGFLISLFPIMQFIGVPFIGDFSDKIGRKKTFTFTLLGASFSYLLVAFAIFHSSFLLLCISRLANGFFAGNASLCFASLSDISATDQDRNKNFGLMGAFGGLSFFLSILCGEYFFDKRSSFSFAPVLPFVVIAILSFSVFIYMLLVFHDTKQVTEKAKFHISKGFQHIVSALQNETLKNSYLTYFFFAIAWVASMQFYPSNLLEVYKKTPVDCTINFLIIGVVWSLANFLVQRSLAKRFTPLQILWITIPILFFFLTSCILVQSYVSFSIHFSLSIFMAALIWTNTFANVSLNASKEIQGRIMGINQSFAAIASIAASLLGGLFTAIHPSLIFVFSAICLFFSFTFLRKIKPNKELL